MKTLKILTRRRLALLLALMMFISMDQITGATEIEQGTNVEADADESSDLNINLLVLDTGEDAGAAAEEGNSADEEKEAFDLTQTERPGQSDTVEVSAGPAPKKDPDSTEETQNPDGSGESTDTENPDESGTGSSEEGVGTGESAEDGEKEDTSGSGEVQEPESGSIDAAAAQYRDYNIFYDADNDVYRLTFNISEDAEGDQVIDLTYALRLLTDYAENTRQLIKAPDYDFGGPENELEALRRQEANVLQPGDVRKFEIFLTSDSKHTYKYKEGSFTLATADLENGSADQAQSGDVVGFDGQKLPDKYVDNAQYFVTLRAEPIQYLLKNDVGINSYDAFNGLWGDQEKNVADYLQNRYGKGSVSANLEQYLLDYYSTEDVRYENLEELMKNNAEARKQLTLTDTTGNKYLEFDGQEIEVDVDLKDFKYNHFYQSLLSFVYGSQKDIDNATGVGNKVAAGVDYDYWKFRPEHWEYENKSWTSRQGYEAALYYYMAHEEIWEKTDNYFQQLLDGGLTNEQATWTSFMMALNIDGYLTGNKWQDTVWPWYNSIQLQQMDIDFSLTKVDKDNVPITDSETGFQIYYIKTVTDADGQEKEVNMYCTYDEATNTYTFVETPSTVWTTTGRLDINYTLMKDIVYYLQETVAPEGYELDPTVYVIMDEDSFNAQDAAFRNMYTLLGDGIKGNKLDVQFVNVKTPDDPDDPDEPDTPDDPDDPDDPDEPDTPDDPDDPDEPDIPDEPVPQTDEPDDPDEPDEPPVEEIPDEEVPLTELPEEEVPLAVTLTEILDEDTPLADLPDDGLVDLFDEDVPLADVPATGDISILWYMMFVVSGCCLLGMAVMDLKRRKEATEK